MAAFKDVSNSVVISSFTCLTIVYALSLGRRTPNIFQLQQ